MTSRTTRPDHADAWDVACTNRDKSNLARAYLDLRKVAQEVVDTCGADSHPPLREMRVICESNRD